MNITLYIFLFSFKNLINLYTHILRDYELNIQGTAQ